MAHRRRSKVPPPPARHDPTGDRDRHPDGQGLLAMQRLAGNQATRQAVEHPLDAGVRGHLERRFGVDLGAVRVRRDGAAAARAGAPAYTVGDRITVDPAHHRTGTLAGDLLLAHEVAHSVQQRDGRAGGHATDDAALEADADRAAAATVAQPATGGFLPALRSALSLRRCRACTPDEEAWLTRFRDESDGERLAALLGDLTGEQLRRLERAPPRVDRLDTDAVAWERAWRDRRFTRMSELTRDSDEALRTAYGRHVVTGVVAGGLRLRVTSEDDDFRAFVEGALTTLAGTRHGLQLIVDLLATGQQVDLAPAGPGTGDVTVPVRIEDARLATQITDESHPEVGALLPPGQQRPGAGTGSVVRLDASTAGNRVTLGGARDRPTIIAMDPAVTVGHELIHALHDARGHQHRRRAHPAPVPARRPPHRRARQPRGAARHQRPHRVLARHRPDPRRPVAADPVQRAAHRHREPAAGRPRAARTGCALRRHRDPPRAQGGDGDRRRPGGPLPAAGRAGAPRPERPSSGPCCPRP